MPLPAEADMAPPVQVDEAAGVAATTMPPGRKSEKLSPVADSELAELSIVNTSVLGLPAKIWSGEKALAKAGGGSTVSISLAVPLLPREEVRSPVEFTCIPGVLLVTSTCTVQLVPAATVPPV